MKGAGVHATRLILLCPPNPVPGHPGCLLAPAGSWGQALQCSHSIHHSPQTAPGAGHAGQVPLPGWVSLPVASLLPHPGSQQLQDRYREALTPGLGQCCDTAVIPEPSWWRQGQQSGQERGLHGARSSAAGSNVQLRAVLGAAVWGSAHCFIETTLRNEIGRRQRPRALSILSRPTAWAADSMDQSLSAHAAWPDTESVPGTPGGARQLFNIRWG